MSKVFGTDVWRWCWPGCRLVSRNIGNINQKKVRFICLFPGRKSKDIRKVVLNELRAKLVCWIVVMKNGFTYLMEIHYTG